MTRNKIKFINDVLKLRNVNIPLVRVDVPGRDLTNFSRALN